MSSSRRLAHSAQYSHFANRSKIIEIIADVNNDLKYQPLRDYFDYDNITWPQGKRLFHLHLENVQKMK
jgi:predicted P-loop ATPase